MILDGVRPRGMRGDAGHVGCSYQKSDRIARTERLHTAKRQGNAGDEVGGQRASIVSGSPPRAIARSSISMLR